MSSTKQKKDDKALFEVVFPSPDCASRIIQHFKLKTAVGIFAPSATTFFSQTPNNYMNKNVIVVSILFYKMEAIKKDRVDVITSVVSR